MHHLFATTLLALLLSPLAHAEEPSADEPSADEPSPGDDEPMGEVVVGGAPKATQRMAATTTVDAAALEQSAGQDLAHAVASVPGVVIGRGASDASKPIIRGQPERRLLVLEDGVRHASQKWGADHATEIDPFSAGSVSVVKGAAGVRYGPDALGGVVLVEPPPMRTDVGVGGSARLVGASDGRRGSAALRLDVVPSWLPDLTLRLEGNAARGGSRSTPTYVLGNTASEVWNAGASAELRRGTSKWQLSAHRYDQRAGVCTCAHSESVGDFLAQLQLDAPIGAEAWTRSSVIERPSQAVVHDRFMARSIVQVGAGSLQSTYAFQRDHRQEYERTRAAITSPQYDFLLRTHSVDVDWSPGSLLTRSGVSLTSELGLAADAQENVFAGLPLLPNHLDFTGGTYAIERVRRGPVTLELGARADHQARTSYLTPSAYQRSLAADALAPGACEESADSAKCERVFSAGSYAAGLAWSAVPDRLELKVEASSASRFPTGDELYMSGSAPTSPIYALGAPNLGPETTHGASSTVGLQLPWLTGEVSGFANRVHDYIYLAPRLSEAGELELDVTVHGVVPRYDYSAVQAAFSGVDGGFTVGPNAPVRVHAQGSMVRAWDRSSGVALVGVPADRAEVGLRVQPREDRPFLDVTGTWLARQTHTDLRAELAPPPEGVTLVDLSLGDELPLRGGRALKFGVEVSNLTNRRYRDYTSLLRYFADEPGRDVRAHVALDF